MELEAPSALTAPQPVAPVQESQAAGMVKLDQLILQKLNNRAVDFIEKTLSAKVNSKEFEEQVTAIHSMGNKEIRESASMSNRMLDRPVKAMETGLFDDKSNVSRALVDLRKTIEDLDPSAQGDLFVVKKLLGLIPFGNRLRDYFLKYQSSQGHINAIINALYRSQDELRKDNAVIEQEKVNMWNLMTKLEQYVHLGKQIDDALTERVAEVELQDPEKARLINEEMLFYVRQKVQDLLTQLAVNIQGYLALDMIRKNNLELIKGVDRATTTTVSALRTAVMVAQALANQKLVLDQITALNTTTGRMIESTSALLKGQTADIHKQAASSTVKVEQLQAAFNNIYETMDMISTYRIEALDTMRQTVDTLSLEVDKARSYVDKVRGEKLAGESEVYRGRLAAPEDDGIVNF